MVVVVLIGAYLLGSIPFSLLIGLARGTDLRRTGSGNPGGMNAVRVLGWGPGVLAAALDFAKGGTAVLLSRSLLSETWGPPWAAAAVVAGHCFSLPLIVSSFRDGNTPGKTPLSWWQIQPRWGGKGIATGLGGILTLSPQTLLGAAGVFALVALLHRWQGVWGSPVVARGATLAGWTCPIQLWLWHHSWSLLAGGLVIILVITFKHVPYLALSPRWPDARPAATSSTPTGSVPVDEETAEESHAFEQENSVPLRSRYE
jgi:glycerol-3-phosphate acyltransferase PlsY